MFAVTFRCTFFDGRIVRPVNAANTPSTSVIGAFSQLTVMRGSCDCCGSRFAACAVVTGAFRLRRLVGRGRRRRARSARARRCRRWAWLRGLRRFGRRHGRSRAAPLHLPRLELLARRRRR